jgi:CelD/BcsL family acetyltransferase involved in cellulose biosynthesis
MSSLPYRIVRPGEPAPAERASGALRLETIRGAEGFAALREEWDELLEHSAANCVFLTWEWLYTWWWYQAEGRRLSILTLRREGRLVAIAPLCIAPAEPRRAMPIRRLEWLGSGSVGSDYLDVIVRRGSESAAVTALADHFAAREISLHLQRVLKDSTASRLAAELASRGHSVDIEPGGICPHIDLRERTWDSYLAERSASHRYTLRRKSRRLQERFDPQFETARDRDEANRALTALFDLHDLRWDSAGGSTALHTAALRRFHREFARHAIDRGWLRLVVLRLTGQPVAALYGLRYGGVHYFYQSGFDPALRSYSLGMITLARAIEAALAEGAREFDLLHGVEAYKFHWATRVRTLEDLWLHPSSLRGRARHAIVALRRWVVALVRRKGGRS